VATPGSACLPHGRRCPHFVLNWR